MRLEVVVGMEIRILNAQTSGLFSNEPFEVNVQVIFQMSCLK